MIQSNYWIKGEAANDISRSLDDGHNLTMKNIINSRFFFSGLWLILSFQPIYILSQDQTNISNRKAYKLVNGQWYDGKNFVRRTFYSVDGHLTERAPHTAAETLDLSNGFVVPPFAEAHNHNNSIESSFATIPSTKTAQ